MPGNFGRAFCQLYRRLSGTATRVANESPETADACLADITHAVGDRRRVPLLINGKQQRAASFVTDLALMPRWLPQFKANPASSHDTLIR